MAVTIPEAGRKALEHHDDSDWTPAYILVFLIPVVFVIVALYSTWRDRRARRAADAEMAMQMQEAHDRRRTWIPDAVAASENPRRPPAGPPSHMNSMTPNYAAAAAGKAGESSRVTLSAGGLRNHPIPGSASDAVPPGYGNGGRPLVSVAQQSGPYAQGYGAHAGADPSRSNSRYPRDLHEVAF